MDIRKLYNKLKKLTSAKRNIPSVLIDRSCFLPRSSDDELRAAFISYCKNNSFGVRK